MPLCPAQTNRKLVCVMHPFPMPGFYVCPFQRKAGNSSVGAEAAIAAQRGHCSHSLLGWSAAACEGKEHLHPWVICEAQLCPAAVLWGGCSLLLYFHLRWLRTPPQAVLLIISVSSCAFQELNWHGATSEAPALLAWGTWASSAPGL